jgi:hypothetical protein
MMKLPAKHYSSQTIFMYKIVSFFNQNAAKFVADWPNNNLSGINFVSKFLEQLIISS